MRKPSQLYQWSFWWMFYVCTFSRRNPVTDLFTRWISIGNAPPPAVLYANYDGLIGTLAKRSYYFHSWLQYWIKHMVTAATRSNWKGKGTLVHTHVQARTSFTIYYIRNLSILTSHLAQLALLSFHTHHSISRIQPGEFSPNIVKQANHVNVAICNFLRLQKKSGSQQVSLSLQLFRYCIPKEGFLRWKKYGRGYKAVSDFLPPDLLTA